MPRSALPTDRRRLTLLMTVQEQERNLISQHWIYG